MRCALRVFIAGIVVAGLTSISSYACPDGEHHAANGMHEKHAKCDGKCAHDPKAKHSQRKNLHMKKTAALEGMETSCTVDAGCEAEASAPETQAE